VRRFDAETGRIRCLPPRLISSFISDAAEVLAFVNKGVTAKS